MGKVRVLIADPFEALGGEEEVAFYIYQELDRNKFEVYITGNKKSIYFQKKCPKKTEIINVYPKGKTNFQEMIRFRRIVKNKKINIINVHGYSGGFFVRLACVGLKDTRIIWTMHTNVEDMFPYRSFRQRISTFVENIINNHKIFTDQIITVCEDSKKKLLKRGITKVPITTIYNGIDIERFTLDEKKYDSKGKIALGFFSRLSTQKDVPLLLESIRRLVKEKKDVKLIIAGDGDQKKYVKQYIAEHRLQDYITYLDFCKNISEQFLKIDILVLPTHYECFPMILLEAMCTGTPVIASDVGGVSEMVKDGFNGYLVQAENINEFLEKINCYIEDKSLIETHGKNGKKHIKEKYSKDRMVLQYSDIYVRTFEVNVN